MKKVLIITQNDSVWNLPVWERLIPLLKKNDFEISGMYLCDFHFSKFKKKKLRNNYFIYFLYTFGLYNFILLGLFATFRVLSMFVISIFTKRVASYSSLCKQHDIPFHEISNPNDKKVLEFVKENNIDIIYIIVGHVLDEEIIEACNIGIINKHGAMLPSNKGIFPYFWAVLNSNKQGISFHKVEKKIDSGDLLCQEVIEDPKICSSMIRFYHYGFLKL